MSSRYTADGKRKSSMTHADRGWTCPCGRTVFGNGGRTSHKRACLIYMRSSLKAAERVLAGIADGTWGKNLRPAMVENFRHQNEKQAARLAEQIREREQRESNR